MISVYMFIFASYLQTPFLEKRKAFIVDLCSSEKTFNLVILRGLFRLAQILQEIRR